MEYELTQLVLENTFEVDATYEVKHFEEDCEVTDVHFDYVSDYRAGFEIIRRADDIDQKLYNLIEVALKDNFDIQKAEAVFHA